MSRIQPKNAGDVKVDKEQRKYSKHSINEMPVDLLDKELKSLIKVIKPSRASLTYERME